MSCDTGRVWRHVAVASMLCGLIACGDDGGGPVTGPSGPGSGPSGATITIGTNGVISPSSVSITTGQSVTFVNNDSRSHEIQSDPHPTHTMCPAINALSTIAAGQTKLTNAFTTAATCTFHDHNDPDNPNLKGTITIR